jgi:hypothetical protein
VVAVFLLGTVVWVFECTFVIFVFVTGLLPLVPAAFVLVLVMGFLVWAFGASFAFFLASSGSALSVTWLVSFLFQGPRKDSESDILQETGFIVAGK